MTIEEILNSDMTAEQKIAALSEKTVNVPVWGGRKGLEMEYNPKFHPVMDRQKYPDIVNEDGIQPVTRIALGFQKLASKRMTELVTAIPVKRVFKPENDKQKEVATFITSVLDKNRIDSVDIDRVNRFFAGCEIMTLWYALEQNNTLYGRKSPLKIRCRTFSPMLGDDLYPLFDEYGDMIAMSVGYQRKKGRKNVKFFDAYTANKHIKWSSYEIEWSLSRNGNYIRENSKPLFCVFADEAISYGDEKSPDKEARAVMQYPKGSTAQYVTWQQAVENLKFHVSELRNLYFTMLQLPDWSYEKMSQVALSGESRKQLFIDAQLKVNDEKGPLIEFFDREINVIKAYAKIVFGESYAADIDALKAEIIITPFTISDEKDDINNLMTANGGKPLMSQRESIERYGQSDDVDKTLKEIKEEEMYDNLEMTE